MFNVKFLMLNVELLILRLNNLLILNSNKHNLCRRCIHGRVYRKHGLVCNVSKNKPNYHAFCENFSLHKTRDQKIVAENSAINTEFELIPISIGLAVVALTLLLLNFFWGLAFILVALIVMSLYLQKNKTPSMALKIGWSAYVYSHLAVYVLRNKEHSSHEDYFAIKQFFIVKIGYQKSLDALKFYKSLLLLPKVELEPLQKIILNKLDKKEAFLILNSILELATLNNLSGINNQKVRDLSKIFNIHKKQFDFLKNINITFEKNRQFIEQQKSDNQKNKTSYQNNNLNKSYKVLGIRETASDDQIKKAFRKLAHLHHPDKDLQNKEMNTQKFQEILDAYQKIKTQRNL